MLPFDSTRDPLHMAMAVLSSADVVFLARAFACHDLRDALRAALRDVLDRGSSHTPDPDQQRLDWLAAAEDRLLDVRGRSINEGVSLREAIDWLMHAHAGGA